MKYTELDGYKNCTLSELMGVLIDSFVPNLYERYEFKHRDGYSSSLPRYMAVGCGRVFSCKLISGRLNNFKKKCYFISY